GIMSGSFQDIAVLFNTPGATVGQTAGTGPFSSSTGLINPSSTIGSPFAGNYIAIDGFDLVWQQKSLQNQMQVAMNNIYDIEANANLSDTEKMFSVQMAMNTWASIANLRTNMLKSVSDTLKTIGRNIN